MRDGERQVGDENRVGEIRDIVEREERNKGLGKKDGGVGYKTCRGYDREDRVGENRGIKMEKRRN